MNVNTYVSIIAQTRHKYNSFFHDIYILNIFIFIINFLFV